MEPEQKITEQVTDEKTSLAIRAACERISSMSGSMAMRAILSIKSLSAMQTDPDFVESIINVLGVMRDRWITGSSGIASPGETIQEVWSAVNEAQTELRARVAELRADQKVKNETGREEDEAAIAEGVKKFLASMKGGNEDSKRVPIVDQAYVIRPNVKALWKALILAGGIWGHPPVVKLTGDPGTGKTMMAQQFAANMGAVFYKVDCAMFAEPGDLYGKLIPAVDENGKLQLAWKDSPFTEAITRGNCVILVDELTRLNYAGQNSLLPLLDGTGEVQPDGRPDPIKRAKGVFIFASCNEGVRHAGTYEITEALQSRMAVVYESEELSENEIKRVLQFSLRPETKPGKSCFAKESWSVVDVPESIETLIWRFVDRLRNKAFVGTVSTLEEILPPSPREIFWLIRMIYTGGDNAWEWCIYNRYSNQGIGTGSTTPRSIVAAVRKDEAEKWTRENANTVSHATYTSSASR
mgnify:CR=1 FL=1